MTDPDALEKLAERLEAGECGKALDREVARATAWREFCEALAALGREE